MFTVFTGLTVKARHENDKETYIVHEHKYASFGEFVRTEIKSPKRQFPIVRAEYAKKTGDEQDGMKNGRYFVASLHKVENGVSKRRQESVVGMSSVFIDIERKDSRLPMDKFKRIKDALFALPFAWCAYHTISHSDSDSRMRLMVPVNDSPSSSDSLENVKSRHAVALEYIVALIGAEGFVCPSCRKINQPMFAPVSFADFIPYVGSDTDSPFLNIDDITTPISQIESTPNIDDFDFSLVYPRDPAITVEMCRAMLTHISPDTCREEWAEVIAGLKHQFGYKEIEQEGYDLANEWSMGALQGEVCDRYSEIGLNATWRSFKAKPINGVAPITIGTIIRRAKEGGYDDKEVKEQSLETMLVMLSSESNTPEERYALAIRFAANSIHKDTISLSKLVTAAIDAAKVSGAKMTKTQVERDIERLKRGLVEEMVSTTDNLPPALRDWYYVACDSRFWHYAPDGTVMKISVTDFNLTHKAAVTNLGVDDVPAVWMIADPKRCPSVIHVTDDFHNLDKRIVAVGNDKYALNRKHNTFPTPDGSDTEMVKKIDQIITKAISAYDDPREADSPIPPGRIILDFLTWIIQNPTSRPNWALFLFSHLHGTGKTFWFEVGRAMLGSDNAKSITQEVRSSSFTSFLRGTKLLNFDEVGGTEKERTELYQRQKEWITNQGRLSTVAKGEEAEDTKLSCAFINSSNYPWKMDRGDRRFAVCSPKYHTKEEMFSDGLTEDFWSDAYLTVQANGCSVAHYFMSRKLHPLFNASGHAPMTDAKKRMEGSSKSSVGFEIGAILSQRESPYINDQLIVMSALKDLMPSRYSISQINNEVMALGYEPLQGVYDIAGFEHPQIVFANSAVYCPDIEGGPEEYFAGRNAENITN